MRFRRISSTRIADTGRHPSARRLAALLLSGLVLAVAWPAISEAQTPRVTRADAGTQFARHIDEAARRFRIPATWICAVMRAESAHDVRVVSSAGAMGLMQVMPETWLELRARYGLGRDPFDVRDNILAGTAYLREMYDRYGNVTAMLAAYNAGPQRYDDYLAGRRALPAETRAYVATLVPLIGAEPLAFTSTLARPDPLAWMNAPLFVARSDGLQTPTSVHGERQRDDVLSARQAQDGETLSERSPSLFVTHNGSERPQ
ncbi:lytic transglycosylase domain-containing protein [Bradyrhizobium sp. RDT46]|uniref:lytic transglycosylase domain-containing protein n=1 Tax=Bradyrhizobium sp. RDT46 TaxID=3341829 RepID=UPI0035C6C684